jgi:16S rRNA (uracil1498-N3)-methyltransferase
MQRYFTNKKENNYLVLDSGDIHHIFNVMRMKSSDTIEVVYEKELYICEVNVNNKSNVLIKKKIETNENITKIVLIIPVLKEQKMDLVLQKATELGISEIIPIITERSIVKASGKEEKKINRWNLICKEASEQSKRISIPVIHDIIDIDKLSINDGINIVCSTLESSLTLKKLLHNNPLYDKITIVVGPEGGLSLKEENLLKDKGFTPVSLGNLIMRVETVPIYILSILNYINME